MSAVRCPRSLGLLGSAALSIVLLACATRLAPTASSRFEMEGDMAAYSRVSREWLTEQGFHIETDEVTCSDRELCCNSDGQPYYSSGSCVEMVTATRGKQRVTVKSHTGGINATSPSADMQALLDELTAHVQAVLHRRD